MNSGFVCLQMYMGKFHFAISFNIAAVEGPLCGYLTAISYTCKEYLTVLSTFSDTIFLQQVSTHLIRINNFIGTTRFKFAHKLGTS